MVSRAWLPPNNKMTTVDITTVPIQDPFPPGTVEITNITFYDSKQGVGNSVTFPLAAWPAGPTSSNAKVSLMRHVHACVRAGTGLGSHCPAGTAVVGQQLERPLLPCTAHQQCCIPVTGSAGENASPSASSNASFTQRRWASCS
jgi:hypothetical protein